MAACEPVGVYGGTFDPIHIGHLAIAEEARWAAGLARVYIVPAVRQPLKEAAHSASPEQRLAMVRLACADNPALVPSDIELRRPPPSYTVDTLAALRAQIDQADLHFILGADAAADLPRWHRAAEIPGLTRLVVVERPGYRLDREALLAGLPGLHGRCSFIEGPRLEISSSELRRRFAEGKPVRYQLPAAVLGYIQAHGLYRSRS